MLISLVKKIADVRCDLFPHNRSTGMSNSLSGWRTALPFSCKWSEAPRPNHLPHDLVQKTLLGVMGLEGITFQNDK